MPEKKETSDTAAKKKKTTRKKATGKTTTARKKTATKTARKKTTARKSAAGAARAKPKAAETGGRLRVRQVRSTIHRPKTFKRTLVALGLKHHQDEVVITDSPSARGMLQKVRHLVAATPEES